MSWTHPICDLCWNAEMPNREPTRLVPDARSIEQCCMCGRDTLSGIYVRRDPATVYFPAKDEDDMDRAQDVIHRVLGGEPLDD